MPLQDPSRYLWDFLNRPFTGLALLFISAIAFLFPKFAPIALRIIAGIWLVYLSIRIAEEATSWARTRGLSPRQLLERGENFRTLIVPFSPKEAAAMLSSSFTSPFYKAKVYRERTRFYFEAYGLIPLQLLKLLFYSGAFVALLGFLLAPLTDKTTQSFMVPGDELSLEGTGVSFRLEEVSSEGLEGKGTILSGGEPVKSGRLAPGKPLWAGFNAALPVGQGSALKLKASGQERFVLYPGGKEFSGEFAVPFLMPNEERYVFLPDHRLILRLILNPKSENSFLLEVFKEGAEKPDLSLEVANYEKLELGEVKVEITPIASVQLRLMRVISLWPAMLGFLLMAIALLLWLTLPVGRFFGFIQAEAKVKVHWAQEEPFRLPPFAEKGEWV